MVQGAHDPSLRSRKQQGRRGLAALFSLALGLAALVGPALAGLALATEKTSVAEKADARCRASAPQITFRPFLPASRHALTETNTLTIVTLGSSMTAGTGASEPGRSYPAVLEAELRRRLPGREVKVINKGIGSQSAYDMYLRMDTDVIDEKPALVIWQTVVNDAIRDVGEEKIALILKKGIRKVQGAGIDLVMMDLQWLSRESRYPHYDDYRAVLEKVAAANVVSVFPRYSLMESWARTRQFTPEELVGMDGLHVVEATYRCLAIRLADGIAAELNGPPRQAIMPRQEILEQPRPGK